MFEKSEIDWSMQRYAILKTLANENVETPFTSDKLLPEYRKWFSNDFDEATKQITGELACADFQQCFEIKAADEKTYYCITEFGKEILELWDKREVEIEKANKEFSEEQDATLPILTFEDLKNVSISSNWLVEQIIPEKSVVLIVGKMSSFKTWLALELSHSFCTGNNFLGRFKCEKVGVLYIDEENGIEGLKEKLLMLTGNDELENFFFTSFEGVKLDRKEWYRKLENTLGKNPAIKVLIIDTFRRVSGIDENEAEQISRFLTEKIRPLTLKYGVTVILLHHLRKRLVGRNPVDEMDEIRGSSDLANYADVILLLERLKGSDTMLIFKQLKSRRSLEFEPQMIEIRRGENEAKFECIGTAEEILTDVEKCAKQIMIWLEENNIWEFKTKEVQDAMMSYQFGSKTVQRAISEVLLPQIKITKVKRGVYQRSSENLTEFMDKRDNEDSVHSVPKSESFHLDED